MSAPAPQLIRSSVDATCADAAPAAKSATLGLLEIGLLEIIGATVACSAAAVSTALAATGRRVSSALTRCLDTAIRAGADCRVVGAIRSTASCSQALVVAHLQPLKGWLCDRLGARRREGALSPTLIGS